MTVALLVASLPGTVAAAGHPQVGPVLLGLTLLVLAAKAGGLLVERLGAPAVLGELLAGICLANLLPPLVGGRGIAFVRSEPTLVVLAEIGVLLLLFDVGMEADLRALLRVGRSAVSVALVGIVTPMALGWGAAAWLLPDRPTLVHVFVGAALTATSVGITARVLKDLGATRSQEGQVILGAAVLDDILGLVVLAAVSGAAAAEGGSLSLLALGGTLLRALAFLAITVGLGHVLSGPIVRLAARTQQVGMIVVFGVSLCFTLAYVAELVGLAGIIGAFAAGLMLDPYGKGVRARAEEATLNELLLPLSMLLVPLFFVLMGVQVDVASLIDPATLGLGAILIVAALVGKLACGAAVLGRGISRLAIGFGMVPRGEVGLIFAGIGASLNVGGEPLLSQGTFSALVLMVLVTTLIAPVGLRWALARRARG